jgi:hypothetical protein
MILPIGLLFAFSLPQTPTCHTTSAHIEDVVEAKVRELKGTELCQFRLYDYTHDLDRDGKDDLLMVFSVEGSMGAPTPRDSSLRRSLPEASGGRALSKLGDEGFAKC